MENKPFWQVIRRIEQRQLRGRKVDWDSWEERVSKEAIERFVDDVYGRYEGGEPGSSGGVLPDLSELREFVDNLDRGKRYTLVVAEL